MEFIKTEIEHLNDIWMIELHMNLDLLFSNLAIDLLDGNSIASCEAFTKLH